MMRRSRDRYVMPALLGLSAAAIGQVDRAFEHFEEAYEDRSLVVSWLRDPMLDNIRSDPRYGELFRRMSLEP